VDAKGFHFHKVPGIRRRRREAQRGHDAQRSTYRGDGRSRRRLPNLLAPVDSGEKSSTLTTKNSRTTSAGSNAQSSSKSCRASASPMARRTSRTTRGETIGINGNATTRSQSPLNECLFIQRTAVNSLDITA
jgi:hypothetical protein